MSSHLECARCMLRQAQEAVQFSGLSSEPGLETQRPVLQFMIQLDWRLSPPELGKKRHSVLRHLMHNPDSYAAVKARLNQRAAQLYAEGHHRVHAAHSPSEAAVRMAIVGNLLERPLAICRWLGQNRLTLLE